MEDNFDVEEELKKPVFSQTGDVWHLGKHTVICGDSTFEGTYKTLLGDKKVNLVCTDPPYFVALENASGKIKNDDLNLTPSNDNVNDAPNSNYAANNENVNSFNPNNLMMNPQGNFNQQMQNNFMNNKQ